MLIGCITIAVIYPFAVENTLSTNRLADSLCLTDVKRHNRTLCKLVQTAEPDMDIYQPVLWWQELLSVETVKNVKPMKLNKTKPNKPSVSCPIFFTFILPLCLSTFLSIPVLPPPPLHLCLGSSTDPVLSSPPWNIDNGLLLASLLSLILCGESANQTDKHSQETDICCAFVCVRACAFAAAQQALQWRDVTVNWKQDPSGWGQRCDVRLLFTCTASQAPRGAWSRGH